MQWPGAWVGAPTMMIVAWAIVVHYWDVVNPQLQVLANDSSPTIEPYPRGLSRVFHVKGGSQREKSFPLRQANFPQPFEYVIRNLVSFFLRGPLCEAPKFLNCTKNHITQNIFDLQMLRINSLHFHPSSALDVCIQLCQGHVRSSH